MKPHVPLDQFRHQAIECAAAGRHELQDIFAFRISFKSAFHRLNLTLDATRARQQFFLILRGVRQDCPLLI